MFTFYFHVMLCYGSKKYTSVEVASTKASTDASVKSCFHGSFEKFCSTKAFISVSTTACMKLSIEVTSKEVWTEARGSVFSWELLPWKLLS